MRSRLHRGLDRLRGAVERYPVGQVLLQDAHELVRVLPRESAEERLDPERSARERVEERLDLRSHVEVATDPGRVSAEVGV